MAAPIASKKALVGITFAMGIAMLVNAGPTVTTGAQRSPFDQTIDVTTPLSPVEKTRAEAWDLSDIEWQRYRALMEGIRGSISPATLSPIEVLGIHARDEGERRRYAERWARLRAAQGDRLLLVGRDPAKLEVIATDLKARGAGEVLTAESDLYTNDRITIRTTP